MRNLILVIAAGFMTVGIVAQKNELKAAEKAVKKQDFAGAVTALTSAEALLGNMDDKMKSKFYFFKGQAYAGKKDYKVAADAFNNLMKHEEATKKRYTEKAEPILNQIINEVSNLAIKQYNEEKDYSKASKSFYLAYKLNPSDTLSVYNSAVSATLAKEYEIAMKRYTELKKLGYTGIVKEYVATDKETGEIKSFGNDKTQRDLMVRSKAFIKPDITFSKSKVPNMVKNMALILKDQGKVEEAIDAMKTARQANPKDLNLLLNEADLYVKLGKMDKFGELMTEAVEMDPTNPTLFFNLGVVNYNQGKLEEAMNFYNKAIELKPDYADAYMNAAVAVLDKEKAIVEEMNKNLSDFDKYDALVEKQKGVYKEALPFLEKADELKRDFDTVRTLLNIYETLGKEEKAKEFRTLYKEMRNK